MGSSEMDKSPQEGKEAKDSRPPPSQDQPSATATGTPDWSGFQAYSPIPPHGFLASSPQAHPYMWGVQHLMPPYATPPHPYVAMYPHGGIYAHPSMPPGSYPFSPFPMPSANGIAEATVNTGGNMESEGKPSEGKEKLPIKRSKGSLGSLNMITGKARESGKTSGASANGAYSKSAESASEGSSGGTEANSQNSGQQQDSAETSPNGSATHDSQNGGTSTSNSMLNSMAVTPISPSGTLAVIPGPPTNLNIGMDYWGNAASPNIPVMQGKMPSLPVGGVATAARDNVQSQLWLQDERELKRQRRKQSNRESARRSRLRKQAECDELAQRAEALKAENASLREEMNRIRSEYDQLLAQNAALKERLGEAPGQDDPRSCRIEKHMSHDAQHPAEPESAQGDQ